MPSNNSSVQVPLILALAGREAQPKGLFLPPSNTRCWLAWDPVRKSTQGYKLTPAAMVTITSWRVISGGIYLASCAVVLGVNISGCRKVAAFVFWHLSAKSQTEYTGSSRRQAPLGLQCFLQWDDKEEGWPIVAYLTSRN